VVLAPEDPNCKRMYDVDETFKTKDKKMKIAE
jgi:hypothetical protein